MNCSTARILQFERGSDRGRGTAETLQHSQAAQRLWIQTAGAGAHRLGGSETVIALTMKINHFVGADHKCSWLEEIQKTILKRLACVMVIRYYLKVN